MFPGYDASGNLYFLDARNNRIRRIDTAGVITTIAEDGQLFVPGQDTTGPATSRSLPSIFSLGVDGSGNVYFVDTNNALIRRVTPGGTLEVFAQVNSSRFIALDPAGNVYTFSAQTGDLLRISPSGNITNFVTLPSSGFVRPEPSGLATDPKGNVYVSGVVNGLLSYSPGGNMTTIAVPNSFAAPMTIDAQRNIAFVAYLPNSAIQELTHQSTLKTLFGDNPQRAPDGTPLREAWFLSPRSIAFSRAGDLYIAEYQACLIRRISAAGVLSTFAGTGVCGNRAPSGNARTANLISPYSIAVDSRNRVWVTDSSLNLYWIAQDGSLSSIIKTPVTPGGTGLGQLAIDSKDRVYVLSFGALYRLLADGTFQAIVSPPTAPGVPPPGTVDELTGLGVDPFGNVYFQSRQNFYIVNDDGTITQKSSKPLLLIATSLAVDASGNIWQADGSEIDISGKNGLGRLGNLIGGYQGDGGFAVSAGLTAVTAVAFSPGGELYFLDFAGIRRFSGSGPAVPSVISQGGIVNSAAILAAQSHPVNLFRSSALISEHQACK
jgi:sugar lactone lactonase YvrE